MSDCSIQNITLCLSAVNDAEYQNEVKTEVHRSLEHTHTHTTIWPQHQVSCLQA